ncbi:MAG: hypothetical protein DLM68_05570 [Hyphomicrobiales bacterium]|nr:MAG: hypothetical protein DLM68_05570 [Hyphomicrobiales bacterium]
MILEAGYGGEISGLRDARTEEALALSADRAEADRTRALLLTLSGWASARIGAAFGVREDRMRLWRSAFMRTACIG